MALLVLQMQAGEEEAGSEGEDEAVADVKAESDACVPDCGGKELCDERGEKSKI